LFDASRAAIPLGAAAAGPTRRDPEPSGLTPVGGPIADCAKTLF